MLCNQDPNLELSLARRVIIFLIGTVESMLFAGTIFGWPQLVHVLKVEGLYGDLCDGTTHSMHQHNRSELQPSSSSSSQANTFNNTRCAAHNTTFEVSMSQEVGVEQCSPQDERFALIFTLTVGCYSVPGVLIGYLLHHAGLRVTRVCAGTMLTTSFLFLGMATKESPHWLFPAMILMALGGNQLRMSVVQFGDLFPLHRSTAITLLSGMYAASAAIFLIFQETASRGIARAHVCWFLACVSSLIIFFSFLMPVHHIPVQDNYEPERKTTEAKAAVPLTTSLLSGSSFLHQYWFFMALFAVNNYQQTYNIWITTTACSVREAGLYSLIYSYGSLFCVFFGPLGGAFTDYMVRRASKTRSELSRRVKEIQASFWPLLVTSMSTTITYISILFFHPAAIYISIVSLFITRPCAVAVSNAYLRIRFPADHFNRLLGIYGTVTSLLMFMQYPHFMWAQQMYYPAHITVLVLLALSYMNPIHLLFTPLMKDAVIIRDNLDEEQQHPAKVNRL